MGNVCLDDLISKVALYDIGSLDVIRKAYLCANMAHEGQFRLSGEPYIIHPLNVAIILANMHADCDTICAGLLHDTLEDTMISKEEIEKEFNSNVANLVEGVTKISKMHFSSKSDQNQANIRKIITSIKSDVRIIIIKLVDRLHNMRTLEYMSNFKQKENSLETLSIYAPIAYYIGIYRIKNELEDLALKFLHPDNYKKIEEERNKIEFSCKSFMEDMKEKISNILKDNNIPSEIKIRVKNIYGIYKKSNNGNNISKIHDLLSLKVLVDKVVNCYIALGLIHGMYNPLNNKFKDYICNPKTNMYQSLHTTVFGPNNRLVQTQIRTYEMDRIASFGLTEYWNTSLDAKNIMQEKLKDNFQFYRSLKEIDSIFLEDQEFVTRVQKELLSDKIYVYTTTGEVVELPNGATIVDFAYQVDPNTANKMIFGVVNNIYVKATMELHNKDIVRIITGAESLGPKDSWIVAAKTTKAKRLIKEFLSKNK